MAALEWEVVELLADQADPWRAADLQFQLAELSEGRPSDDPLTRRVDAIRRLLRSLDERRSGPRRHPMRPPARP